MRFFAHLLRIVSAACFACALLLPISSFADDITILTWTADVSNGTVSGIARCGPKSGSTSTGAKNWIADNWPLQNGGCFCRVQGIDSVTDWNSYTTEGKANWYGSGTNFSGGFDACVDGCAAKCKEKFESTASYQQSLCGGACPVNSGGDPEPTEYTITYVDEDENSITECGTNGTEQTVNDAIDLCTPQTSVNGCKWWDADTYDEYDLGQQITDIASDMTFILVCPTEYTITYVDSDNQPITQCGTNGTQTHTGTAQLCNSVTNPVLPDDGCWWWDTNNNTRYFPGDTITNNTNLTLKLICPKFTLTTTSDTTEFSTWIAATGEFYIDCGNGGTFYIGDTSTGNQIGHVTPQNTDQTQYKCSYTTAGEHIINYAGLATGYNTNSETPAIIFSPGDGVTANAINILSISGSLGRIFRTLANPTNGQSQPRFIYTFANASHMTNTNIPDPNYDNKNYAIPPTLFDGVTGEPTSNMFRYTFSRCKGLTGSIPATLFAGIHGEPTESIFRGTFNNCSGLTGSIPATLFSGISGAPKSRMFESTFDSCSGLTNTNIPDPNYDNKNYAIPPTLFSGIHGEPADYMFSETFSHCSGLTGSIPGTLFSGISGAPAQEMFLATFLECDGLTGSIPSNLFAGIHGEPAEAMFVMTFFNCSGLTGTNIDDTNNQNTKYAIPPTLFCQNLDTPNENNCIYGEPADTMYWATFFGCSGLNGSVPSGLFAGIHGNSATGMFAATFYGCTGLTEIPAGLYGNLTDAVETEAFAGTFYGCTGLTEIPSGLFSGITGEVGEEAFSGTFYGCSNLKKFSPATVNDSNAPDYIPVGFFNTNLANTNNVSATESMFEGTQFLTSCPADTYLNYDPDWLNSSNLQNKAMCTECPSGWHSTSGANNSINDCYTDCPPISGKNLVSGYKYYNENGGDTSQCIYEDVTTITYVDSDNQPVTQCGTNGIQAYTGTAQLCNSVTNPVLPDDGCWWWDSRYGQRYFPGDTITPYTNITLMLFCPKFKLTTTSDTTEFTAWIAATGKFHVDCGDGGTFLLNNATNIYSQMGHYTSDSPNSIKAYTCRYTTAGEHVIYYDGLATGYSESTQIPTIRFYKESDSSNNHEHIKSIDGFLGGIFPTLIQSTTSQLVPQFLQTFYNATNLTKIPERLFVDANGNGVSGPSAFVSAFRGCSGLTEIPPRLFVNENGDGVSGYANGMFAYTFEGCSGLTKIPERLFVNENGDGISGGAASMFFYTFANCTGLTGSDAIPERLFVNENGDGVSRTEQYMFAQTFFGCTGLTEIPEHLFVNENGDGISGAAEGAFLVTFANTGLTEVPAGLFSGITGEVGKEAFEGTFYGCTGLTEIPSGLFSGITGEVGKDAFYGTFYSCSNLKKFNPATVNDSNAPDYIPIGFFNTNLANTNNVSATEIMFEGTQFSTSCPADTYLHYDPDWLNQSNLGKAMCTECPVETPKSAAGATDVLQCCTVENYDNQCNMCKETCDDPGKFWSSVTCSCQQSCNTDDCCQNENDWTYYYNGTQCTEKDDGYCVRENGEGYVWDNNRQECHQSCSGDLEWDWDYYECRCPSGYINNGDNTCGACPEIQNPHHAAIFEPYDMDGQCATYYAFSGSSEFMTMQGLNPSDLSENYDATAPLNQNVLISDLICIYNETTGVYDKCRADDIVCQKGYYTPQLPTLPTNIESELDLFIPINNFENLCVTAQAGHYTTMYDNIQTMLSGYTSGLMGQIEQLESEIAELEQNGGDESELATKTEQLQELQNALDNINKNETFMIFSMIGSSVTTGENNGLPVYQYFSLLTGEPSTLAAQYATCPTTHPNSDTASWTQTQCYKSCTSETIENSTAATGRDYYGNGVDTCVATSCSTGYRLYNGECIENTEPECTEEYDDMCGMCYEDETCDNPGEHWDSNTCKCETTVEFTCESQKYLHIGANEDNKICLSRTKPNSISLAIGLSDGVYYIPLSNDDVPITNDSDIKMRVLYNGTTYSAHDDSTNQ